MSAVLIALPGNEPMTQALADTTGLPQADAIFRTFPDGETYLRISSGLQSKTAILVCTLHRPDTKFIPLFFAAHTLRELGAERIGLVAPYLAYMRQDRRFQPGEGITSTYFASLLSHTVDWIMTVDPHLHRYAGLNEIYSIPAEPLHAARRIAAWIDDNLEQPVFVGPDIESEQWVEQVARACDAPCIIARKERRGDRSVEVTVPDAKNYTRHTPIVVDDIISTAHTMIETVRHLRESGMRPPVCIGVHAVFAGTAYEELDRAGAALIATCNTIPHPSNRIDIAPLLAEALIRRIHTP